MAATSLPLSLTIPSHHCLKTCASTSPFLSHEDLRGGSRLQYLLPRLLRDPHDDPPQSYHNLQGCRVHRAEAFLGHSVLHCLGIQLLPGSDLFQSPSFLQIKIVESLVQCCYEIGFENESQLSGKSGTTLWGCKALVFLSIQSIGEMSFVCPLSLAHFLLVLPFSDMSSFLYSLSFPSQLIVIPLSFPFVSSPKKADLDFWALFMLHLCWFRGGRGWELYPSSQEEIKFVSVWMDPKTIYCKVQKTIEMFTIPVQ